MVETLKLFKLIGKSVVILLCGVIMAVAFLVSTSKLGEKVIVLIGEIGEIVFLVHCFAFLHSVCVLNVNVLLVCVH